MALPFPILCACVGKRYTPPSNAVGTPGNQELGAENVFTFVYITWRMAEGLLATMIGFAAAGVEKAALTWHVCSTVLAAMESFSSVSYF